jgi:hypothetical protein
VIIVGELLEFNSDYSVRLGVSGPPKRFLPGAEEPRDPTKSDYPLPYLLFTAILMFLCHLGARSLFALKFRDNAPSAPNFARLFGVERTPPASL